MSTLRARAQPPWHLCLTAPVSTPAGQPPSLPPLPPLPLPPPEQDLDYHVPSNTQKGVRAYLLKKVSGFFEAHQMAALVGAGPGKTGPGTGAPVEVSS